jgi:hypothetical protein
MTGKSNAPKNGVSDSKIPADVAELLGDNPNASQFDWDGSELADFLSLCGWVARCGGLLSVGSAKSGAAIYCSVRFGEYHRGYTFDDAIQLNNWAGQLIPSWKLRYLRQNQTEPIEIHPPPVQKSSKRPAKQDT